VLGFAFVVGVVSLVVQRARTGERLRRLDLVAAAAATGLPLGMAAWPEADGALQRVLFATAYAWYARELLRRGGSAERRGPPRMTAAPGPRTVVLTPEEVTPMTATAKLPVLARRTPAVSPRSAA
jgi:hypothetical protein